MQFPAPSHVPPGHPVPAQNGVYTHCCSAGSHTPGSQGTSQGPGVSQLPHPGPAAAVASTSRGDEGTCDVHDTMESGMCARRAGHSANAAFTAATPVCNLDMILPPLPPGRALTERLSVVQQPCLPVGAAGAVGTARQESHVLSAHTALPSQAALSFCSAQDVCAGREGRRACMVTPKTCRLCRCVLVCVELRSLPSKLRTRWSRIKGNGCRGTCRGSRHGASGVAWLA
jgi:hypothetical protein